MALPSHAVRCRVYLRDGAHGAREGTACVLKNNLQKTKKNYDKRKHKIQKEFTETNERTFNIQLQVVCPGNRSLVVFAPFVITLQKPYEKCRNKT